MPYEARYLHCLLRFPLLQVCLLLLLTGTKALYASPLRLISVRQFRLAVHHAQIHGCGGGRLAFFLVSPPAARPRQPAPKSPAAYRQGSTDGGDLETVRKRYSDQDPVRFHDDDYCPAPPPAARRQRQETDAWAAAALPAETTGATRYGHYRLGCAGPMTCTGKRFEPAKLTCKYMPPASLKRTCFFSGGQMAFLHWASVSMAFNSVWSEAVHSRTGGEYLLLGVQKSPFT